jgi:hypothetical protein
VAKDGYPSWLGQFVALCTYENVVYLWRAGSVACVAFSAKRAIEPGRNGEDASTRGCRLERGQRSGALTSWPSNTAAYRSGGGVGESRLGAAPFMHPALQKQWRDVRVQDQCEAH